MPAPQAVYLMVVRWIEVVVGPSQPWATAALARLVLALLWGQRLTAARLLRS